MSEEYKVSVAELAKKLELIPVIPEINTNDIYITQAEVNRPALQLAGFFDHFSSSRVQIIGNVEYIYISIIFWKRMKTVIRFWTVFSVPRFHVWYSAAENSRVIRSLTLEGNTEFQFLSVKIQLQSLPQKSSAG